jgi:outer membrane protein OmpA-like peptidoglycan-associated protein
MNNTKLLPVMLAIATLLGACSSVPRSTSLLEQTRTEYRSAQGNPNIAKHAPLEIKQAGEALAQADAASSDRDSAEKIDKLAYLAKQKIALAREMATKKSAEADVASAGKERDQMRLDQRTNEADRATVRADQANVATQIAQNETAAAQARTQEALARTAQLEAQLAAQLADLAAKKTERGMVITLSDVLFGTDQARLSQEGMLTAQKLADVMQKNPQRTVLIEGFTDSTGASAYNQELSERRATAVRTALQELGVGRDRVAVRGYGESYPVASNDTTSNRQLNRRVEIIFSDANGKVMQR